MDAKEIGFAAKDILIGIGTAVAGAKGGPEAAKGVSKAGDGIDRILGNVMPGDKNQTREERFDRGDFAARTKPAVPPVVPPQETPVPRESPAQDARIGAPKGDAQVVTDHLKALGWTEEKITQILGGPERASLASLLGREVGGTRATPSDGESIRPQEGRSHPKTSGFRQDPVEGVRVPDSAQKA